MPHSIGPNSAHVAEWASILKILEEAGRHPARTPEARRQKARNLARSEERLVLLRATARALEDAGSEPLTPRRPGDPIRATSLDR